jgi:hypothetical protein
MGRTPKEGIAACLVILSEYVFESSQENHKNFNILSVSRGSKWVPAVYEASAINRQAAIFRVQ